MIPNNLTYWVTEDFFMKLDYSETLSSKKKSPLETEISGISSSEKSLEFKFKFRY